MRAVLRTRPGEVAVVERPIPEPGPGEALVHVRACGICGSDLARLRDPDEKWNHVILGHECSGVVEAVGRGLAPRPSDSPSPQPSAARRRERGLGGEVRVGQRVALLPLLPDFTCPYCQRGEFSLCDGYSFFGSRQDGGLAEYLVAPVGNFLPIPDEVDDEAAAMLEPLSVATKGCLLAGLCLGPSPQGRGAGVGAGGVGLRGAGEVGKPVLIMGAGAIGLLAVQVALALGASPVIACDVIPEKLLLADSLGAQTVLSITPSPVRERGQGVRLSDSVPEQVREMTGGRGVDVCLECSGHHAAFGPALESVAKGETLVLVGTGPGEVPVTGAQRELICRRMLTLRGQWMSYGPTWPGDPWTLPLALLAQGRLDPVRLITHRFPRAQAAEAVHFLLMPGADYLKVMITM